MFSGRKLFFPKVLAIRGRQCILSVDDKKDCPVFQKSNILSIIPLQEVLDA
jgi:hypothetical protein